jgi:hypothetical protein
VTFDVVVTWIILFTIGQIVGTGTRALVIVWLGSYRADYSEGRSHPRKTRPGCTSIIPSKTEPLTRYLSHTTSNPISGLEHRSQHNTSQSISNSGIPENGLAGAVLKHLPSLFVFWGPNGRKCTKP